VEEQGGSASCSWHRPTLCLPPTVTCLPFPQAAF
jgi:hypothetical protein